MATILSNDNAVDIQLEISISAYNNIISAQQHSVSRSHVNFRVRFGDVENRGGKRQHEEDNNGETREVRTAGEATRFKAFSP